MIGQGEVNFLSCGMRLPFLFLACFLSVSAHAGSCQFVWSLSGLGMNLGQAKMMFGLHGLNDIEHFIGTR